MVSYLKKVFNKISVTLKAINRKTAYYTGMNKLKLSKLLLEEIEHAREKPSFPDSKRLSRLYFRLNDRWSRSMKLINQTAVMYRVNVTRLHSAVLAWDSSWYFFRSPFSASSERWPYEGNMWLASSKLKVNWWIDRLVFCAVLALFQPINGGFKINKTGCAWSSKSIDFV